MTFVPYSFMDGVRATDPLESLAEGHEKVRLQ